MKNVRLKTSLHPQQIEDRMIYNPEIIELHLNEPDLYTPEEIVKTIVGLPRFLSNKWLRNVIKDM